MVTPSVVAIDTTVQTYDIFNRPVQREGAGSGWVLHPEGLIVTNNHVIADAEEISVTFSDETVMTADLIGRDALTDIALLKVDATGLDALPVGDSEAAEPGAWVLSIGNSLGLGVTAKQGIVSRRNVSLPVSQAQTVDDLIETSAAINPGNSGGPLVNIDGRVIGITSIKIATAGVEGLGYAISTNQAVPIIEELNSTGYIVRPWLGISAQTVTPVLERIFGMETQEGALIVQVADDSPADQAGLQQGDVIVSIAGSQITDAQDLRDAIHDASVGEQIEIVYRRNNNEMTTKATLIESPPPEGL